MPRTLPPPPSAAPLGDTRAGTGITGNGAAGAPPCLTPAQLDTLTRHLRDWGNAKKAAPARLRLWLLFLLLRYGALRLGEALALERADLDGDAILVRGANARRVPLPPAAALTLRRLLDSPELCALRSGLFRMDPGYVRRFLYARATACGLPRMAAGPRALREARGLEMLRRGLPAPLVQAFLGRSGAVADSGALRLYLRWEASLRTSARNAFTGAITRLEHRGVTTLVTLRTTGGLDLRALITSRSAASLNLAEGVSVTALVKAMLVTLHPPDAPAATANLFTGRVLELVRDRDLSELTIRLAPDALLCAVADNATLRALRVAVGQPVCASFTPDTVVLRLADVFPSAALDAGPA